MYIKQQEYRALRRIFRWRRTYWLTFAAVLPSIATAIGLIQQRGWLLIAGLPIAIVILHAAAWRNTNRARCPRCGEFFFLQRGPLGPMGTTLPTPRRCVHCGLRYEPPGVKWRNRDQ